MSVKRISGKLPGKKHLQVLTTIASMLSHLIEKMHTESRMREREIELITLHRIWPLTSSEPFAHR